MSDSFGKNKAIVAALVVAAIAFVIFGMGSCGLSSCGGLGSVPRHPYDWSRLQTNGSIKSYVSASGESARLGIDVSYHNNDIDWDAVAAAGVDFAYVRVGWRGYTEGAVHEDPMARENLSEAMAAGIDCGVYFFSQAINEAEAREEADFACDFVDEYGIGDFPVVFDLEENEIADERIAGMSTSQLTKVAVAFCEQVKSRGYTPMIYGNDEWLNGNFDLATIANKYQLWLAQYRTQPDVVYDFKIWQYTSTAHIDGVSGRCDLNLMFPSEG